jgi:hypothetical protein
LKLINISQFDNCGKKYKKITILFDLILFDKNISKGDKDSLGAFFNSKRYKTPFLYNFNGIAT